MAELPGGIITFLLTDIEGSTRLWEQHPEPMRAALARHDALAAEVIGRQAGTLVKSRGEGDSLFAVFAHATDALAAACALQLALAGEPWAAQTPLRVRAAIHTGEADLRGGDYYGPAVNRCARLRAAGHGGQVLLSAAAAEAVGGKLPSGVALRDLGERRLKDLTRPEHVFQLVHPALPGEVPPLATLDVRPHNLPTQPTPLVGREQEVRAVRDLVVGQAASLSHCRLVTLTGPGGVGKTRLGLQVAAELIDDFEDGVFFIDLAPITNTNLVAATIAQALGVQEEPGRSLAETLKAYLREKQMLLVLDNFEQVGEAAPLLAELLAATTRLKLIVTSRAVLSLRGEQAFPVLPLSVPDPRHLPPILDLAHYAAVELFVQRAVNVKPDFAVTDENAPAVAQICHRLDGLPLALELAAARIRLLSPAALLARLQDRLKLLTGGARDLPERQQTLRSAIAWSYDLLAEDEQALFRRLSVFVGGCTLETAEAVCHAGMDLPVDLLDGATSLVEKSLLRQEEQADGEARFAMLETIREYALERLVESGEADSIQRRHAEHFLELAERAAPGLRRPAQAAWPDGFDRELDNLRAALVWSKAQIESPEFGLRLASVTGQLLGRLGHSREGREWLAHFLALPGAAERTAVRARALSRAGSLAGFQGDYRSARSLHAEGLGIWRELDEKPSIAASLLLLGIGSRHQGDFPAARTFFEECLALCRELGDQYLLATLLAQIGQVFQHQGDLRQARQTLEESLAIMRALGDRRGIGGCLVCLGAVAHDEGDDEAGWAFRQECLQICRELRDSRGVAGALNDLGLAAISRKEYAVARSLLEESLVLCRELEARHWIAIALNNLGIAALLEGDAVAARTHFTESLLLKREVGDRYSSVWGLEGLAGVAMAQGQAEWAARLFGAAEAARAALGTPASHTVRDFYEPSQLAARAALGEEAFAAAWERGRATSLDQAVSDALAAA